MRNEVYRNDKGNAVSRAGQRGYRVLWEKQAAKHRCVPLFDLAL
ncbi:MAG: hypothetical protein V4495_17705 [Pseudomonadota bacterium]